MVRAVRSVVGRVVAAVVVPGVLRVRGLRCPRVTLRRVALRLVPRRRSVIARVLRRVRSGRIGLGRGRVGRGVRLRAGVRRLERLGRPVPYALRDELRLQRSLDDAP